MRTYQEWFNSEKPAAEFYACGKCLSRNSDLLIGQCLTKDIDQNTTAAIAITVTAVLGSLEWSIADHVNIQIKSNKTNPSSVDQ